jgi:RimJ/RimL family protein N-acetyltransferase
MNHPDVRDGVGRMGFYTDEAMLARFEKLSDESSARAPDVAEFTVYDLSDETPVGTAGLFSIDHAQGIATYGIALGERRGQGLGTDTTRVVLRWAFEVLGLHNVLLTTLAWNEPAISAYRRAGFIDLGVRRSAAWSRGARADEVLMQAVRPG